MGDAGQDTVRVWLTDQLTYYATTPPYKPKPGTIDYKAVLLLIRVIRGMIEDFLSPHTDPETYQESVNYLFGIHASPLPRLCKALGLDVTMERLKLVEWKVLGKRGDPIFGFLSDPRSLSLIQQGVSVKEIYKILQGEPNGRKKITESQTHI